MKKFELLAGAHIGPDWTRQPETTLDMAGKERLRQPSRTYQRGDVVFDKIDLAVKLGDNKFKYLGEGEPTEERATSYEPSQSATGGNMPVIGRTSKSADQLAKEYGPLEQKTIAELRVIAEAEGVDLDSATTKADIMKVFKSV